jgi:ATP-dependent RNA helicase DDX35
MQRSHLAPVILQLKALGIENVLKFNYLAVRLLFLRFVAIVFQRPSSFAMIRGLELLYALGAIDKNGHLTEIGEKMAEMPLPPIHSKVKFSNIFCLKKKQTTLQILLSSGDFECTDEILSILAMLQIQDVFMFPLGQKHRAEVSKRRFAVEEGDHLMLLNVFAGFEQVMFCYGFTATIHLISITFQARRSQKWCSDHFINYRGMMRAIEIRNQLERLAKRFKVPMLSSRGFIGRLFSVAIVENKYLLGR